MSELISLQHNNGYSGELRVGEEMTIYKDGKEVLHTSSPAPKSAFELYKVLMTMPEFMKTLRGGIKGGE